MAITKKVKGFCQLYSAFDTYLCSQDSRTQLNLLELTGKKHLY